MMETDTSEAQVQQHLAVIIEDHADTAAVFVEALESAGFTTMVIGDGREALSQLPFLQPALIILDLQLPFVPGERVLAQIRGDERLARTRVVVVTAEQQLASHLAEKVDLVLLKPVPFGQLRELASRWQQWLRSKSRTDN